MCHIPLCERTWRRAAQPISPAYAPGQSLDNYSAMRVSLGEPGGAQKSRRKINGSAAWFEYLLDHAVLSQPTCQIFGRLSRSGGLYAWPNVQTPRLMRKEGPA